MAAQTAIRSYVIVVLGGLGSLRGALLGGLFLGMVEALTAGCYPDPSKGATYQVTSGLLVFLVVLRCGRRDSSGGPSDGMRAASAVGPCRARRGPLAGICPVAAWMGSEYKLDVARLALYSACLTIWSLLAGVAGQFSFGHVAIAGIAGYAGALWGRQFPQIPVLGTSGSLSWSAWSRPGSSAPSWAPSCSAFAAPIWRCSRSPSARSHGSWSSLRRMSPAAGSRWRSPSSRAPPAALLRDARDGRRCSPSSTRSSARGSACFFARSARIQDAAAAMGVDSSR